MVVKICGITNTGDARAAVDAGATALGFNFYPNSPRYIAPESAARIVESVPAGIWKVGVFVNETPAAVEALASRVGLDVAQLHGDEPPGALPRGIRVWKALPVDASFDGSRMDAYDVEAFLLDAPAGEAYGGSGRTFDWSFAGEQRRKVILAGGLDATNVREAIRRVRPWGVDACSRLESAPGKKDQTKMREFLVAALAEDRR